VAHLSALKETGIVVIDRENNYHKAFLYNFNRGYIEKEIPQAIYGCGTYAPNTLTVISKDGLIRIEIKTDEVGKPKDLVMISREIKEFEESLKDQRIELTEDIERILCKYSQSKEFVRNQIIYLLNEQGEDKFRKLVEQFVSRILNQYRQDTVPVMRREEIDKDIDKGLILYQLKYIKHLMVVYSEIFMRCGFVTSSLSLKAYIKVIECCERAVFGIELRTLQNDMLIKTRAEYKELAIEYIKILSAAIEEALAKRGITKEVLEREGLTAADAFYSSLGNVEEICEGLIVFYERCFFGTKENAKYMEIVNNICIRSLEAVKTFRNTMHYLYEPQKYFKHSFWTSNLTLMNLLHRKNVMMTSELCKKVNCSNKNTLKEQLFKLAKLIFHETKHQCQLLDPHDSYYISFNSTRAEILEDISSLNEVEALKLAIEYKDYNKAVELCESTGNRKKLYELVREWQESNFLEVAFRWYIDSYKNSPNANRFLLFDVFEEKYYPQLEHFLQSHYPKLLWLLYVRKKRNGVTNGMILKQAESEPRISVLQVITLTKK
jgi:hypothetical protein